MLKETYDCDELLESLENAIASIRLNTSKIFNWYCVKNSVGSRFNIGGRNVAGELEVLVTLLVYDSEGVPKCNLYNNILEIGCVIFHNFTGGINSGEGFVIKDFEEFFNYMNRIDFRLDGPKQIITEERVIQIITKSEWVK